LNDGLRALPAVDELLREEALQAAACACLAPRSVVVAAARAAIAAARAAARDGQAVPGRRELLDDAARRVAAACRPALARAVNATGVVLHTGLGRAPLAPEARAALLEAARGYAVLEIDRATGERSQREQACADLLCELTGAEAATVVNNNAAACLLALAALCRGREVIVARGQLVEIGGSFRIPEVMAESGARLREVGATNKVRRADYEAAVGPETAAILKVHTSNFKVVGFTEEVPLDDLVALARARSLLCLEDLGSGNLVDLRPCGIGDEPLVQDSVRAGADAVTFSGDKLLGGPQAGLLVGRKEAVAKVRRHPLFRAVRPDKLCLAALEATLRLYRDEPGAIVGRVPSLALLAATPAEVERRARALAEALGPLAPAVSARVVECFSQTGSGALPTERIESRAVALEARGLSPDALAARLRAADPPVFARIQKDRVLLDLRTVLAGEEEAVVAAVRAALAASAPV